MINTFQKNQKNKICQKEKSEKTKRGKTNKGKIVNKTKPIIKTSDKNFNWTR